MKLSSRIAELERALSEKEATVALELAAFRAIEAELQYLRLCTKPIGDVRVCPQSS
jgi:hypothetical protein